MVLIEFDYLWAVHLLINSVVFICYESIMVAPIWIFNSLESYVINLIRISIVLFVNVSNLCMTYVVLTYFSEMCILILWTCFILQWLREVIQGKITLLPPNHLILHLLNLVRLHLVHLHLIGELNKSEQTLPIMLWVQEM